MPTEAQVATGCALFVTCCLSAVLWSLGVSTWQDGHPLLSAMTFGVMGLMAWVAARILFILFDRGSDGR